MNSPIPNDSIIIKNIAKAAALIMPQPVIILADFLFLYFDDSSALVPSELIKGPL